MGACGMTGFRFHDLRHTFRTQGAQAGVPLVSAAEARALLALDPFYAKGQSADVDVTRANKIASPQYGAMAGESATTYTQTLANTDQLQLNQNAQVTYTTNITQMTGDTTSTGMTVKMSGGDNSASGGQSLTVQSQDQLTYETDLKFSYFPAQK